MKKTKVLIYVPQLLETGGIESHIKEFTKTFAHSSFELYLLVANFKGNKETKKYYQSLCKKVILIQNKNAFYRLLNLFVITCLLKFQRFNFLYTNGQGKSIYLLRKILGKSLKWIHHHHTSGDLEDQKTWPNEYKIVMQTCDKLIACAEPNALEIMDFTKRNVVVVPCFSRQLNYKKNNPQPEGKVKLGYFGRLIKEKGVDLICQLSMDSDLSEIEFYIWGKGEKYPPSFFNSFKVTYMGSFTTKEELNLVIEQIDGFILLSQHPEGLPISLLEVMSSGLPWLATNRGGIKSLSTDSNLNFLLPYQSDYEETKKSLLTFARKIKLGNTNRENQINKYLSSYSSEVIHKKWETIFS
jgi:glycosyltransferase involved in cell wall biosynthesis